MPPGFPRRAAASLTDRPRAKPPRGALLRHHTHRRADQEPKIGRRLERKAGAPTGHHIHRPARVSPAPILLPIHPELATDNLSDLLIDAAQLELPDLETHRRAAIATPPRQMKHQGAMLLLQLLDEFA